MSFFRQRLPGVFQRPFFERHRLVADSVMRAHVGVPIDKHAKLFAEQFQRANRRRVFVCEPTHDCEQTRRARVALTPLASSCAKRSCLGLDRIGISAGVRCSVGRSGRMARVSFADAANHQIKRNAFFRNQ
jgi:hypothetical protein